MVQIENAMTDLSVCAIIVAYHPAASMMENMSQVLAQVQRLVVIDNGSNLEELDRLRAASRRFGFHLIENQDNLGIAAALNRGVMWAKGEGYSWVILFDQDSKITDNFMDHMFASLQAHPSRELVASLHPRYVDPVTGIEPYVFRAHDGGPITSMTSGALMPMWIFDKIGYFPEEYFIDQVDTEYGYRIRAGGYLNADSRQAVLMHSAGTPKRIRFAGFSFEPTHHSATRRYYFTRNRIVVYKKYFWRFPKWVTRTMYIGLRETIKCFVAEQDRPRKFRNLLLGTWDGLTGRMGKREGV